MKNIFFILLGTFFAFAGHSVNDPVLPEYIVAFYSEPATECDSFGPGFAAVFINTVADTYEKRQKLCGDAMIHWEHGVIEKSGQTIVKIANGSAIALPGDEPLWQDFTPMKSGHFFLDVNSLIEYSITGQEILLYYLGFEDGM